MAVVSIVRQFAPNDASVIVERPLRMCARRVQFVILADAANADLIRSALNQVRGLNVVPTSAAHRFFNRMKLADPVPWHRAGLIAAASIAAAVMARLLLEQIVPGVLPFLFSFPAVIVAALLGGAIAGWLTLGGCQLLTMAFVLPHWIRDNGARPEEITNLLLATVSLAMVIWASATYRATERGLRRQCENEVVTLSLLANEADHRTKNNFQIAAALLHTQSMGADIAVREELQAAAGRLTSIAAIYGSLSARRPDGDAVPLLEHLEQIGDGVRAGLLPPGVTLSVSGENVTVPATIALTIGLIANEWITNAIKYAFPTGNGEIWVYLAQGADGVRLEVRDDGVGLPATYAAGFGSRLLASLTETLGGTSSRHSAAGTTCVLIVPLSKTALG